MMPSRSRDHIVHGGERNRSIFAFSCANCAQKSARLSHNSTVWQLGKTNPISISSVVGQQWNQKPSLMFVREEIFTQFEIRYKF